MIIVLTMATLCLLGAGCNKESSDDVTIANATSCLDSAQTAAAADACQLQVSGMTSQQASLIRCSANLIAQGITGSRLASAFTQLNQSTTSGTQTSQMMSYLVFAQSLPLDTAALTYTNCTASGVQSVAGLASLIQAATTIASLSGATLAGSSLDPSSASFNSAQLLSLATSLYSDNSATGVATKTTIGQVAVTAQASLCGTGSSLSNQDVCTRLNAAIASGNGNSAQIGNALLNKLLNQ